MDGLGRITVVQRNLPSRKGTEEGENRTWIDHADAAGLIYGQVFV